MRRGAHCFAVEIHRRTQPTGKPSTNPLPRQTPSSMKPSHHLYWGQPTIGETLAFQQSLPTNNLEKCGVPNGKGGSAHLSHSQAMETVV